MSLRLDSHYELLFQGALLCSSSELYSYSQLCRETLFMLYCSHWVLFTAGHVTCLSTVSPKNIHIQKNKKRHSAPPEARGRAAASFLPPRSSLQIWVAGIFFFIWITLSFTYFDHLSTPEKKKSQKNVTKRQSEPQTGYWQFIRHGKEADKEPVRSWAGVSLAEKIPRS